MAALYAAGLLMGWLVSSTFHFARTDIPPTQNISVDTDESRALSLKGNKEADFVSELISIVENKDKDLRRDKDFKVEAAITLLGFCKEPRVIQCLLSVLVFEPFELPETTKYGLFPVGSGYRPPSKYPAVVALRRQGVSSLQPALEHLCRKDLAEGEAFYTKSHVLMLLKSLAPAEGRSLLIEQLAKTNDTVVRARLQECIDSYDAQPTLEQMLSLRKLD